MRRFFYLPFTCFLFLISLAVPEKVFAEKKALFFYPFKVFALEAFLGKHFLSFASSKPSEMVKDIEREIEDYKGEYKKWLFYNEDLPAQMVEVFMKKVDILEKKIRVFLNFGSLSEEEHAALQKKINEDLKSILRRLRIIYSEQRVLQLRRQILDLNKFIDLLKIDSKKINKELSKAKKRDRQKYADQLDAKNAEIKKEELVVKGLEEEARQARRSYKDLVQEEKGLPPPFFEEALREFSED